MAKKEFSFMDMVNIEDDEKIRINMYKLSLDKIKENKKNNYELTNIDELADSIEQLGLLQPLLVKELPKGIYEIVAGHRRYNAIKKLVSDGRLEKNYEVLCKTIEEDENEIITRLKLHETNLQTRSLLKLPEEEKIAIVEDYMDILKQAKEKGITLNGKPVKGKTRDLIADRFQISARTAQDIINKTKEKEEGGKIAPLKEDGQSEKKQQTNEKKLNKILKQIEKIEFENTEEEIALKEKIIELLM
ncbi:ParB/Srx family N-terminal domain-containing protein [Enterococcus faecalis]